MASTSLHILSNSTSPINDKRQAVLDFIKSFGAVSDANKQVILTRIRGLPFLETLDSMLNAIEWLDATSAEDIGSCSRFASDLKLHIQDEENFSVELEGHNLNGLSNNQIRKISCQQFSRLSIPKTWFSVADIDIWPTLILKSPTHKRLIDKTAPIKMREDIEKVLKNTDYNAGEIVELEPGYDSLKVKCLDIASRSRIQKFLQSKLPNWSIILPKLYNPVVRIGQVKEKSEDEQGLKKWLASLKSRNDWTDPDNEVKIAHVYKRTGYIDVLIEVTPAIREKIERKFGTVNLGYSLAKATDFFNIKICRQCSGYGHLTHKCKLVSKCAYCSKNHTHLFETCPAEKDRARQRCPNCWQSGKNAYDKDCPIYRLKLRHELEKINFAYKLIMN